MRKSPLGSDKRKEEVDSNDTALHMQQFSGENLRHPSSSLEMVNGAKSGNVDPHDAGLPEL